MRQDHAHPRHQRIDPAQLQGGGGRARPRIRRGHGEVETFPNFPEDRHSFTRPRTANPRHEGAERGGVRFGESRHGASSPVRFLIGIVI